MIIWQKETKCFDFLKITFYKRGDIQGLMNKTVLENYTMTTIIHHGKVIADLIPNYAKDEYYHLDLSEYLLEVGA
nr:MAG TPA: hypothetical protein [Bacteriophage sp.]